MEKKFIRARVRKCLGLRLLSLFLVGWVAQGCSSLLYHPSRGIHSDPAQAGYPPEEIHFRTADGVALHGWYFRARGAHREGLILQFHGNAENLTTHYANLIWLVDEGFDLFIFDYRGYGRSEGEPSPEGLIQDGVAALEWAGDRSRREEKSLFVYGQSLGGAVALRSVAEWKDRNRVRGLVAESTFLSYRSVARSILAKVWLTWPFQWVPYLVLSDRWGPSRTLDRIPPIPLYVIHGDQDPVVPLKNGIALYEAAQNPKEFLLIPGGTHTDSFWIQKGKYRPWLLERLRRLGTRH